MVSLKKIVATSDALLDCIPVVSTITNGAQLLYKLAHKTNAFNPSDQGLANAIRVHVVQKEGLRCCIGLVPFAGNLCNFLKDFAHFVRSVIQNFRGSCKRKTPNSQQASSRSSFGLEEEALVANCQNETFLKLLDARAFWETSILLRCLYNCHVGLCSKNLKTNQDVTRTNAFAVLHALEKNNQTFGKESQDNISYLIQLLSLLIKTDENELMLRAMALIPSEISLGQVHQPLFNLASKLEKEPFEKLVPELLDKCRSPSLKDLYSFWEKGSPDGQTEDTKSNLSFCIQYLVETKGLHSLVPFIDDVTDEEPFNFFLTQVCQPFQDLPNQGMKRGILKSLANFQPFFKNVRFDFTTLNNRAKLFETYFQSWKESLSLGDAQQILALQPQNPSTAGSALFFWNKIKNSVLEAFPQLSEQTASSST